MKYRLRYILGAGLVASVLVAGPLVLAEDGSTGGSDDTTTVEMETHNRGDRLTKFKTQFKISLTTREEASLKLHCVAAQGLVSKLNTRFGNSVTRRSQAYSELSKNLAKLLTKLKAKGVDTTTLEQQITTLNTKIATYTTDLAAYKQALADLKDVDCKADPAGFQAALEAARAAHETLVTDAVGIKTYVLGTIKPTLVTIRTQLEQESTNNSTTGGTN